jgi:SAM-dependent methyltransferase
MVQTTCVLDTAGIFDSSYPYFSSYSEDLLRHSRLHAESLIQERRLNRDSLVVEIASNDGYLLRNFVAADVPVIGIDPAPSQAVVAEKAGVPTKVAFFGRELARKLVADGRRADVIIGNNVLAHVPDVNDLVAGMSMLLKDGGVVTIENPYVRDLIANCEFDTIYHEHRCYFSCTSISNLVERHGLHLNHVEYFPALHGGTLRWHVSHGTARSREVEAYLLAEEAAGMDAIAYYEGFATQVTGVKSKLQELLSDLKASGASIAAYGAAAKGSTLLNVVGIGRDVIDFVVDRNEHKQGLLMPGCHIPIVGPEALLREKPDYVLLLAWNFETEIARQQEAYVRAGGRFIVPIPEPVIRTPAGEVLTLR